MSMPTQEEILKALEVIFRMAESKDIELTIHTFKVIAPNRLISCSANGIPVAIAHGSLDDLADLKRIANTFGQAVRPDKF